MIKEGTLQDFRLLDLLQILTLAGASGELILKRQGKRGVVGLNGGQIVQATHADLQGVDACAQLSLWSTGIFEFSEAKNPSGQGSPIALKQVADASNALLLKQTDLYAKLPEYFSSRSWISPQQLYNKTDDALVAALGGGIVFGELVLQLNRGEVEVLEDIVHLYEADQVTIHCANEEYLRRLFGAVIETVVGQFSAISGVKLVDSLEKLFNDNARERHLALRLRGGHLIDDLPDNWQTARLMAAYQPLWHEFRDFVVKVYGEKFVERILEERMQVSIPAQQTLWRELNQTVTTT